MELMDESLTRFLGRSTAPLPYHSQLNICHDVSLALSYLHSNAIIHRDLSSNNVLLIGEGSRAKVTDFGISKLLQDPKNYPSQEPNDPSQDPNDPSSWNTSLHASRSTHFITSLLQQARLLFPRCTCSPDNHKELPQSRRG